MRETGGNELVTMFVEAFAIVFLLAVLTIGLPLVWGVP